MQPNKRRKKQSTNRFLASWKGRVKDFKVKEGTKCIKEILIQHFYMHQELVLQDYPSYLEPIFYTIEQIVCVFVK